MHFRLLRLLPLIILSFVFQNTCAQEVIVKRSTVIEHYKHKPYYIHFVKQGETLFAIAKAYNISAEELVAENPLIDKGLKADMVLRIPKKAVVETPEVETQKKEAPVVQPKFVEKQKEQGKAIEDPDYIIYLVKKQETLYGLSRQYNIPVKDIIDANPGFDGLKEGMEIRIPRNKTAEKPASKEVPVGKVVIPGSNPSEIVAASGETLYNLSKTYNITIDELIKLNPELSDGLKAGMVIKLRKPEIPVQVKPEEKTETVVADKTEMPIVGYKAENIKTTYKVALLLPFLLENAGDALESPEQHNPSDIENFNYMQFYAGFMLAADSLEQFGLHARIQVLDGDKLNDTLTIRQTLRKTGLDKMDLIVGPMYANSFTVAARFARKHEIGIINPLSRRENIVDGNPYVIKTQVSNSGIAAKLSSFITRHYPDANIIAVRKDAKELKQLADAFESLMRTSQASHSFNGSYQTATYTSGNMADVSKRLKPGVKNIILFFSNNKSSVPSFVSLLNPFSRSNDIILIGMDGWDEIELETEFLVHLNFHQVTSTYVNYDSEAVQQFITRFRNKYGAVPTVEKYAFLGYDIGWYFLTSLMWYGDQYMGSIPYRAGTGLQNNFAFSGSRKSDGLQNQNISIVKLQDYKMVKVE